MRTTWVRLADREYQILIGTNLAAEGDVVAALRRVLNGRRCWMVSDSNVYPLYGTAVRELAVQAGAEFLGKAVFPAGEASKTLSTLADLYRQAVTAGVDRKSVVLALGGGVVGDVAGFCAATFMRGIDFVQIPTSLLALVDSSVGGKTGVDLPEGKNLVGAFHQPKFVLGELAFLGSLPEREWGCGLAETIKYGVILDPDLFAVLEAHAPGTLRADAALQERIVTRCCELKAEIVGEDETDTGRRAILNYGHTFGHALESLGGYAKLNHGEAVAIGMQMAANLAVRLGLAAPETAARQAQVLQRYGLPLSLPPGPAFQPAAVLEAMSRDKKTESGQIRCVLPHRIGKVSLVPVANRELLLDVIGGACGKP